MFFKKKQAKIEKNVMEEAKYSKTVNEAQLEENIQRMYNSLNRQLQLYANNPDNPDPVEKLAASIIAYGLFTYGSPLLNELNISSGDTIIFTAFYIFSAIAYQTIDDRTSNKDIFVDEFMYIVNSGVISNLYLLEEDDAKALFNDRWQYYGKLLKEYGVEKLLAPMAEAFQKILEYNQYYDKDHFTGFPKINEIMNNNLIIGITEKQKNKIDIDAYINSFPSAFGKDIQNVITFIKRG